MKEILKITTKNLDFFYQFAFAILPEELQAQQLVIDALGAFKIEYSSNKKSFIDESEVKKNVFSHLYKIGNKRSIQLRDFLTTETLSLNEQQFYDHSILQRSILFFHYRLKVEVSEMEQILNCSEHEILEALNIIQEFYLERTHLEEKGEFHVQ